MVHVTKALYKIFLLAKKHRIVPQVLKRIMDQIVNVQIVNVNFVVPRLTHLVQ